MKMSGHNIVNSVPIEKKTSYFLRKLIQAEI